MLYKRRDSIAQFEKAGRQELAAREYAEIDIVQEYLPEALSKGDLLGLIDQAIEASEATQLRDMGKVMSQLKSKIQGRAEMGAVSALVKQRLAD